MAKESPPRMRKLSVYLFIPNVIGYLRVLMNCVAFGVCFSNKWLFSVLYFFSFVFDGIDGWCARKFNQGYGRKLLVNHYFAAFRDVSGLLIFSRKCRLLLLCVYLGLRLPLEEVKTTAEISSPKIPSQCHVHIASPARWTALLLNIILMNMNKIIQAVCSSEPFTRMVRVARHLQNPQPQTGQAARPPQPPSFLNLERVADHNPPSRQDHDISWVKMMVTFCLTSVIEVALASVQRGPHSPHLPPLFLLFNLSIFFAFSSLFVGKYMNPKFKLISRALQCSGVFFTATAFVLATTIPFPLWLRCSTWAIYGISWSAVLVSRYL